MFTNLGTESEHRDANKNPTGRRHAPREMTNESGMPTYYTEDAVRGRRASEDYRLEQQQSANIGPSFMDQMFAQDAKRGAVAQGEHGMGLAKHTGAPKDKLNLFDWDTHGTTPNTQQQQQQKTQQQGHALAGGGAGARSHEGRQRQQMGTDAESIRGAEARKFEHSSTGNFLAFSDGKDDAPLHRGRRMDVGVSKNQGLQAPFATGDPVESGGAGLLPRGKKYGRSQRKGDGETVQGFRGMGKQCQTKATGRRTGAPEPSQVFLPYQEQQRAVSQQPVAAQQHRHASERPSWLQDDVEPQQKPQYARSVHFSDQGTHNRPGDGSGYPGGHCSADEEAYMYEQ